MSLELLSCLGDIRNCLGNSRHLWKVWYNLSKNLPSKLSLIEREFQEICQNFSHQNLHRFNSLKCPPLKFCTVRYSYTCAHVYQQTCVHKYAHTHTPTYAQVYRHMHTGVHTHMHTQLSTQTCIHIQM